MMKTITSVIMIVVICGEVRAPEDTPENNADETKTVEGYEGIFTLGNGLKNPEVVKPTVVRIVRHVNKEKSTWKAGGTDFSRKPPVINYYDEGFSFKNFMGSALEAVKSFITCQWLTHRKNWSYNNYGYPESFDAREKWLRCPSIGRVYNHGRCASCGAVAVLAAFTDRLCIETKGAETALRSFQQVISCCPECGKNCDDSKPVEIWNYLQREGVVTGGEYKSGKGCQPYLVEPCNHNLLDKIPEYRACVTLDEIIPPECQRECYNGNFSDKKAAFKKDIKKVEEVYTELTEEEALHQLFTHGPIVASFAMCTDFINYKSGVYQYLVGESHWTHSVKVIGWGVTEDGIPYWLAINSWSEYWGDKGLFKIIRGKSFRACGFQLQMSAGTVRV